jgi:hypothetical protein
LELAAVAQLATPHDLFFKSRLRFGNATAVKFNLP